MSFIQRDKIHLLLIRISLGIVFIWIGIDMLRSPTAWIGFIPPNLPFDISRELGLQIASFFDIAIGVLLIVGLLPRITAALASIHFIGIIATHGLDAVLIRDIGLLGASLALLFWPTHGYRRRSWLRKFI